MAEPMRQMHLNCFMFGLGHHEAAWRYKGVDPTQLSDIRYYHRLAQMAERAKFDSIFFADGLAGGKGYVNFFEPLTLMSSLAGVTKHIGLIGTVSTTYTEPYNLARYFASLDHISKGRVGWNIVTTGHAAAALNFNRDAHMEHTERYERAGEFLDVTTALWDSWEDGALVYDKAAGVMTDAARIREINHVGKWFKVKGPLTIPRVPQGHPVLVQAGSSEDGRAFAAKYAEVIYTMQTEIGEARQFYQDMQTRLVAAGRSPGQLKILPGIAVIIGETEEEAKEKEWRLNELSSLQNGLRRLSTLLGRDMSQYPLDGPLPELPDASEVNNQQTIYKVYVDLARRENLTIRQLIHRTAAGRGDLTVVGTPLQIADQLEKWFVTRACDGFNIMPPYFPGGLEDFIQHVIPELQRRGLFRTEYTGSTLREHLGLPRPVNRFAAVSSN
ncbi:LLM class flavin-dependent oxidoreductase [Paenibacillus sp.]|uniref:LLM class flavin-dependent oxidoreductase n=1 Tax=Paenibacillus sp. TaxID=58172 RepID=UPI002D3CCA2C|nr:LLM class flavin-dependent oxidoreductase [Paenibacillus sp.]HZG87445.1 LLM class flavin-dependent oxidoreductase [Paenibacillus sp.]